MASSNNITSRPEYAALNSFHASVSDAPGTLERFTEPLRNAAVSGNEDDISDTLSYEWKTILAVAADTAHEDQSQLVDFVTRLRKETLKTGNGDTLSHEGGSVWSDLPTFGWQVREAWNFSPKQPDADEAAKTPYVNQNAFLARLTNIANDDDPKDTLDFSLYALWSLREALEDDAPEGTPGEGAVRAAAVWILYSVNKVWKLTKDGKAFDGKLGKAGRKYKDEEWKGFNASRWTAWKNEFQTLVKDGKSDATSLVERALQEMERVEES